MRRSNQFNWGCFAFLRSAPNVSYGHSRLSWLAAIPAMSAMLPSGSKFAVFAMRPLCSPMILSRIARRSVSPPEGQLDLGSEAPGTATK